MKLILPALIFVLALAGCSAVPEKYSTSKVAPCVSPATNLKGVPYTRGSNSACAVAVAPFDLGVWHEAPYNSRKIRGLDTVDLGCAPLTPAADSCSYCGLPGFSRTLLMNFDASVYPEGARVRRAVLAVYAWNNPMGLYEAQLRGRLNVGGEQQSLARNREIWTGKSRDEQGWVFYDVTAFAARAVNERRDSVQFEVSLPCVPDKNPVTAGVLKNEPRLVVEFE